MDDGVTLHLVKYLVLLKGVALVCRLEDTRQHFGRRLASTGVQGVVAAHSGDQPPWAGLDDDVSDRLRGETLQGADDPTAETVQDAH